MPWYDIYKKPVEFKLEEIHIILKSPDSFDKAFYKSTILVDKLKTVQKIID